MHSLASAFRLISDSQANLVSHFDGEAKRDFRSRTISAVLATDLAYNFPTINAFKQMVQVR